MKTWTHFKPGEVEGLNEALVEKLEWARQRAGVPFVITSGYRSPEQNQSVGGVKESSHTKGLAVDLRCGDSVTRYKMVNALLLAGFKRIGVYNAHCHADLDPDLPQGVIWLGESH